MAKVILGPVIGKVTHNSARILIETDTDAAVKCTLTPSEGDPVTKTVLFSANVPSAFAFDNLKDGVDHKVTFDLPYDKDLKVAPGFQTHAERFNTTGRVGKVAVVSCNKIRITRDEVKPELDLWTDLGQKAKKREVSMILHIGDNVYLDSDLYLIEKGKQEYRGPDDDCKFWTAMKLLNGMESQDQWCTKFEECVEICQDVYRETWGHMPQRQCMAVVPNIMILDDHDVRDDWGDRPEDQDKTSKLFFVATCAFEAYNRYQRQLYEDYTPSTNWHEVLTKTSKSYHMHTMGQLGLLFLEARASKTFHRKEGDTSDPMIGSEQWKDIEAAFSADGLFSKCRLVLVLSPMPLIYLAESVTMKFAKFVDDLYGMWTATTHKPELTRMLKTLFEWRAKKAGYREVLVVGGDVHEGGYTDIIDKKCKDPALNCLRQVTASAVSNKTTKVHEHAALNMARSMVEDLDDQYSFKHYQWTGKRNFVVCSFYVEQGTDEAGVTRFSTQLFCADNKGRETGKVVSCTHREKGAGGGWAKCCFC